MTVRGHLVGVEGITVADEPATPAEKASHACGRPAPLMRETWPDGRTYLVCTAEGPQAAAGNVGVTLPPGQVYVLGDNRANSLDSRSPQIGPVAAGQIVGPAVYLYRLDDLPRGSTRLD